MKKIILFTIVAGAMAFTSCQDFLYPENKDASAPTNWYSTQAELDLSMQGIYQKLLATYNTRLSNIISSGTDEEFSRTPSGANDAPFYYSHTISNGDIKTCWQDLYKGIDNSNMLIEHASNALANGVSNEVINAYKSEALFMRGFYHMMLTLYWGDVPLKLTSTQSVADCNMPFSSREEVLLQAMSDMSKSIANLPQISKWGYGGRVSKSAAKGILARAYLNAAGLLNKPEYYVEAREWALDLIDDNIHSLNPSYEGVFTNYNQNIYDIKESIWEVEALGYDPSASYGSTKTGAWNCQYSLKCDLGDNAAKDPFDLTGKMVLGVGRAIFISPPTYYDRFEEGDLRRDWTIAPYYYTVQSNEIKARVPFNDPYKFRHLAKFRRINENISAYYKWASSGNYPLLRYSDVLLMFAEAENEVNSGPTAAAYDAVNMVRRRAFGLEPMATSAKDILGMNYEQFKNYIIDERSRELGVEGLRKLDLLRWDVFHQKMKQAGELIANMPATISNPSGSGTIINPAINQSGTGNSISATELSVTYRNIYNNSEWEKYKLLPIPVDEVTNNKSLPKGYNNPGW